MTDEKKIVLVAFETDAEHVELLHELLKEFTKNLPGLREAPQGVADADSIEGMKFVLIPKGFDVSVVPEGEARPGEDPAYR